MPIEYYADDHGLTADEFIVLFARLHRQTLDRALVQTALQLTINLTARDQGRLVACARLLSDHYLFTAVTEAMVDPDYSGRGIEAKLLALMEEVSPTGIWFGSQKLDDESMRIVGWHRGPVTYYKTKPLRRA